jgi:hypothetical protein
MIWRIALAAFLTLCLAALGQQSRAQFNGCSAGFCGGVATGGGGGSVAFDAKGTSDTYAASATGFAAYNKLTVGSGANRALIVMMCFGGTTTAPTGFSVVWDSGGTNQSMTQIGATQVSSGNNKRVQLWGLVAPTSGNKTLAISWTNSQPDAYVDAIAFTGVNQTGGSTTFYNATVNTGSGGSATVTVTSASTDAAVDVTTSISGAVGQTVIFEDSSGAAINGGASYNVGSASVAFSWATGSGSGWVDYGVAIKAN